MNPDVLKFCELAYNYDVKHPAKIHKYHEMVLSTLLHGQFRGEEQTLESFFVDDGAYKDKRLTGCYIRVEGTNGWWGYQLNLNNGIVQYYIDMLLCQENSRKIQAAQNAILWERVQQELPSVIVWNQDIYWFNFQSPETRGNDRPIRCISIDGSIKDFYPMEIAHLFPAWLNHEYNVFQQGDYTGGELSEKHYTVFLGKKMYTFVYRPNREYYPFMCVGVQLTSYESELDKRSIHNDVITQLGLIIKFLRGK